MKEVDYAKLSGQYASFLIAAGGVSITVLTLVLSLNSAHNPLEPLTEPGKTARVFLIAALIAATVSCFIGAHMMAETAAFFTRCEKKPPEEGLPDETPLGKRLFVLATSNIFIAVNLVLFSIVLLPTAIGDDQLAARLNRISLVVFLGVVLGALCWMFLSAIARLGLGKNSRYAIAIALTAGLVTAILCYTSKELWPQVTFVFIIVITAVSLIYFAFIFKIGNVGKVGKACTGTIWRTIEMVAFCSAITVSYAFLVVAFLKLLWSS